MFQNQRTNQQLHFLEEINQRTAGRDYKNLKQLGGYKGGYLVFSKKLRNHGYIYIYVYINWFFDFFEDHGY
jgi:hypothetical protein